MAPSAELLPRTSSPGSGGAHKLKISSVHEFVTHLYYELVPG